MRCWRADGSGAMEIGARHEARPWTALAQIAADALALDIEEIEFPSGTSDLPDAGIAGGSAHTAIAGMAIHNAGAEVIARLAELATNDRRSPLFGAGNAGVIARAGRLCRRDDESRGESYADILGRAGLTQIECCGTGVADPLPPRSRTDRAMRVVAPAQRRAGAYRLRCTSRPSWTRGRAIPPGRSPGRRLARQWRARARIPDHLDRLIDQFR